MMDEISLQSGDLAAPDSGAKGLGAEAFEALRERFKKVRGEKNRSPARIKAEGILRKAVKQFERGRFMEAARTGLEATRADETLSTAFHTVALALERIGELHKAITYFEKALALDPSDAELYYNLGNTAWRMGMHDGAIQLFRVHVDMKPDSPAGYNNLAGVMRDLGRYDEALEIVRAAIYQVPEEAILWNTLGSILIERGDVDESLPFFHEALRLDARCAAARHNMAYAALLMGDFPTAEREWRRALKEMPITESQRIAEAGHGLSNCLVGQGKLEEGWAQWEARHHPDFRNCTLFAVPGARWEGQPVEGKRILAIAEQGIGDEVKFATALPDLIEKVGPEGEVILAVSPRLETLFRRSMPGATVGHLVTSKHNGRLLRVVPWIKAHEAAHGPIDYYTPFGDTLRYLRSRPEDFEPRRPFLTGDPDRVSHWKERLAALGPGLKVGVCWRSGLLSASRIKYYCPLEHWKPVFQVPGVTWVNLQYDDSSADRAEIASSFGTTVHDFEEIDLKNSLDDNAALCSALDLVISAPTAAAAMAGAVGTHTWVLLNTLTWTMLGTDHYPWYARTDCFTPVRFADWPEVMARMAEQLAEHSQDRRAA